MSASRARIGCAAGWLIVSIGVLAATGLHAQPQRPLDSEVKAAYLFNFGKFVTWPADAIGPADRAFDICTVGRDSLGSALERTLEAERIDGQPVVLRRLAGVAEAPGCRVLFISAAEDARLPAILRSLDGAAVLTVSDMDGFTQRGGMIQFVSRENRVRFEVNLAAADEARLRLGADLLRVALAVRRNGGP